MTDTKFYTTTKSRLNRLGYKGFSKEDYVKAADSVGIVDLNNPTNEELIQAVNFLSQQRDKANSVLVPSNSSEIEATSQDILATYLSGDEVTVIDEQVTQEQQPESASLTTTDKEIRGMVNYKAASMGIQLAASEVEIIAEQIDSSGSSFSQTIRDIESALIVYIDYRKTNQSAEVSQMINRVTTRVTEANQAVSQEFSNGVREIKTALEVADQQQKRDLSTILNRLRIAS